MAAMMMILLVMILSSVKGFSFVSPTTKFIKSRSFTSFSSSASSPPSPLHPSSLNMIDPHHLDLLTTLPHHAGTIISSSSSSSIISSSLDAVLDVTTPSDASWWDNWLNLFRQTLLFVHDDIVSPAVSKVNPGFTQTWGGEFLSSLFYLRWGGGSEGVGADIMATTTTKNGYNHQ